MNKMPLWVQLVAFVVALLYLLMIFSRPGGLWLLPMMAAVFLFLWVINSDAADS